MDPHTGPRTLAQATASHANGFNVVRLVCATLVVVFHAFPMNSARPGASDPVSPLLAPHTDLGALAVGVFFLISGIFISQSWERDPHLGRYLLRRVARIVPGLFVCLLVMTVLAVGLFSDTGWRGLLTPAPWRYIFGNTVLHWLRYIIPPEELKLPGVFGGETLNGPLWTLYWEARMYVIVALIGVSAALPLRTWMRGAALFLLAAANLFPEVLSGYIWEIRLWSLFLAGMFIHTLGRDLRIGWRHVACALALVALDWTRSQALTPSPLTWFGIFLVAGTVALAVGTARLPFARHVQLHDYSYGIYIYHWPVLLALRTAFAPLGHWRLLLLALAVTGVLAVLSWHFVEAPALRAVRHRLRRGRAPAPAQTQPASVHPH